MLLSVVIPSYNGRRLLGECLSAVFRAMATCRPQSAEVIVVDDGSTDGSAQWLRAEWPSVKVLALNGNGGFPRAANRGAVAASGDWIAMLNNDTSVDAEWITAARLTEWPVRVGAVASKVVSWDEAEVQSAGDGYTRAGLAFQMASGRPFGASGDARRVFSACAAAAFYRREAFWDAGGFDEAFGGYYEDVDLGFRMNLRGWETIFVPDSVCRHRVGASYGRLSPMAVRNSARNSEVVFISCMPAALLVRSLPAHLVAIAAQACLRASQRRFLPFAVGKMQFLSSLPAAWRRRRLVRRRALVPPGDIAALIERRWLSAHFPTAFLRRLRTLLPFRPLRLPAPVAPVLADRD
jgi:GT2 family glycosyltransferase